MCAMGLILMVMYESLSSAETRGLYLDIYGIPDAFLSLSIYSLCPQMSVVCPSDKGEVLEKLFGSPMDSYTMLLLCFGVRSRLN